MAKVKLKKNGISSREEYEQKVNRTAMLEVECSEITARYKLLQQRLKARADKQVKERQKEQKELLAACAEYAAEHQNEVLKKGMRYGETTQARYGFQLGSIYCSRLHKRTYRRNIGQAHRNTKAISGKRYSV